MTIRRCPRCNQNFLYSEFGGGDVIHDCNSGNETLDNEDVKAIGNFTDPDGSTGSISKHNVQLVPDNRLQFSPGFIMDRQFVGEFTGKGNKKVINRTRKHFEYIKVNND